MKLGNYREIDVSKSIEARRTALHHLEEVEKCLWTDDIESALESTLNLHLSLVNLSRMQSAKRVENKFNQLYKHLNANGINIRIIPFEHKKTD